jgi:hypothetical protein
MAISYGGRRARNWGGVAVPCEREARERARSVRVQEHGVVTAASANASVGRVQRERVAWSKTKLRNLRQTQVLERVIRRSRIIFQPPTDTGSSLYIYVFIFL